MGKRAEIPCEVPTQSAGASNDQHFVHRAADSLKMRERGARV
jgi:hypothetical protein